jgi:uncharacterized integral membrane protein
VTNFEKPRDQTSQPPVGDPYGPPPQGAPTPVGAGPDIAGPDAGGPAAGEPGGATDRPAPAGFDDRGRVKRGRVSTLWISLIAAAVVLILLIIFIAQNLKRASIHFLGFAGHMPTGLVVLIAAIIGVLLAAIPGTIRIAQLRRSLKHNTPKEERTP